MSLQSNAQNVETKQPKSNSRVRIIGAGLAGCEAAMQLANRGIAVDLYEMKTHKRTPAQVTDGFAELVCSNSFRSNNIHNAVGLLKEELRRLGGFLINCAEETRVEAGDALAVDRVLFSKLIEKEIRAHPQIRIVEEELTELPLDGVLTIVATGPLTSDALSQSIAKAIGQERLAFYDAISPIIEADSVDMEHAFFQSRWGKGQGDDYLNCPMTSDQYDAFYQALCEADRAEEKDFEKLHYFEGCLPIEVMAERGPKTLTFGPFKPVGLTDPKTQRWPHAVLQLRKENVFSTAYNLVGCQTRLKQPAQRAVFAHIPALKNARFLRYGAIHRNTYLDSPRVLDAQLRIAANLDYQHIYFAGQITGVEGYLESMACGWLTALIVAHAVRGEAFVPPPATTALGGLYHHVRGSYVVDKTDRYAPSNITWALIPPLDVVNKRLGKDVQRAQLVERALGDLRRWQIG